MTRGPHDRFPTEDATRVRDLSGGGSDGAPLDLDDDFDLAALLPPLDDRSGPARRIASSRAAAMINAIVDAALEPPAAVPEGTKPVRIDHPALAARAASTGWRDDLARRRGRSGSRLPALMAAAMVVTIFVGGATAAVWVVARPAPQRLPLMVPAIKVELPRHHAPRPAPAPVPVVIEEDDLDEELADEPVDMPAEVVRRIDRELPDDAPPDDVLQVANQRRKEKRWRDADSLYRRVMIRHKGSDAAVVATVASAALHLDRLADPAGALRRYRRALRLRPSGPLAEESRWGVAEALRALGDVDSEAEALRAFVAAHADSANAAAAQRRLGEIARER